MAIRGRKVDLLISQVRRETENEDPTASTGIQDVEFLQYLNDAQDRLQSVITATYPVMFVNEKELSVIVDTEKYDIPDNAYMENKLITVEYSPSGISEDYYHLEQTTMKRRDTAVQGFPVAYVRRSGQILLQPRPQQAGLLRVNYVKTLNRLDKRRGIVSIVTLGSNSITNLELDASSATTVLDTTSLLEQDYITIVNKDGVIKMRNIPISGIDNSTGVVTIDAGFTFDTDETIEVGDFAVSGKDASTHSELPRMCERYLIAYCAWKILKRDSSVDYAEQEQELLSMEQDIVNSFSDVSDDVRYVPQLNHWSDWSD
jgi:hypothetical protein